MFSILRAAGPWRSLADIETALNALTPGKSPETRHDLALQLLDGGWIELVEDKALGAIRRLHRLTEEDLSRLEALSPFASLEEAAAILSVGLMRETGGLAPHGLVKDMSVCLHEAGVIEIRERVA